MSAVPQAITVVGATYTVPGADTIEPLAASVSYDGSGAAGTFMPCLSIYSQDGHLISRTFPQASVAAGASAEVSFIPFVPPASGTASGGGIQYDVDNVGGSLQVETTGQITAPFSEPSGSLGDEVGTSIAFNAPHGVYISSDPTVGAFPLTVEQFATGTDEGAGIEVSVSSDTGKTNAIDIGYGNDTAQTGIGTQRGISIGGGSNTSGAFDSLGIDVADRNRGAGGSFGARLVSRTDGAGNAIAVSLTAAASGAGTAYAAKVVSGLVDLNLPLAPGVAGTLWNNGGIVTVS